MIGNSIIVKKTNSDTISGIIKYLKTRIAGSASYDKLDQISWYLSQKYNKPLDAVDIINFATRHLRVSRDKNDVYYITINEDLKYQGIPLKILIRQITYGDGDCKPYPLVSDAFNYVQTHLYTVSNLLSIGAL